MGRTNVAVTSIERRRATSTLAPLESYDLYSEVLVPEQFFILGYRSAGHWSGARRLLFAVLQDAVACWLRYRHACTSRGRRQFRETHAWFWAKDRSWLYAFERICEHLELDPDYIRRGLTRWQTAPPSRQTPLIRAEPVSPSRHLSLVRG